MGCSSLGSQPAIRAIRQVFQHAHIAVVRLHRLFDRRRFGWGFRRRHFGLRRGFVESRRLRLGLGDHRLGFKLRRRLVERRQHGLGLGDHRLGFGLRLGDHVRLGLSRLGWTGGRKFRLGQGLFFLSTWTGQVREGFGFDDGRRRRRELGNGGLDHLRLIDYRDGRGRLFDRLGVGRPGFDRDRLRPLPRSFGGNRQQLRLLLRRRSID